MTQLDASSEGLSRAESVAERVDIFRTAVNLLQSYEWPQNEPVNPHDALQLARFLAEGMEGWE